MIWKYTKVKKPRSRRFKEIKVFKKLKFGLCSCGDFFMAPHRKCYKCIENDFIKSRTRICPVCETPYVLEDWQNGKERVCLNCRRESVESFLFYRIENFFEKEYFPSVQDLGKKIRRFSLLSRNDIQAITDYSEFKIRDIEFQSVEKKDQTWDHVNAMTFTIENYIYQCIEDRSRLNKEYLREYLLKYAIQFRVSQKQNLDLVKYQNQGGGITPEQYISVTGPIKDLSIEESVEKIRPYFING